MDTEIVRLLLDQDANIESACHLSITAQQGRTPIVQLLPDRSARVDVFDQEGNTPLYLASKTDVMKLCVC